MVPRVSGLEGSHCVPLRASKLCMHKCATIAASSVGEQGVILGWEGVNSDPCFEGAWVTRLVWGGGGLVFKDQNRRIEF